MDGVKTLLCGVAKMENKYIEEWVRYYKNIGIDKIVLFDNNTYKGERLTDVPYIKEQVDNGYIDMYLQPEQMGMQTAQYTECYNIYRKEYDWLMFFDIDEYMVMTEYNNIGEYLSQEKFKNYDMIHIQWRLYDDNNLITVKNGDYSLMNRFTHPLDVKSLLGEHINDENVIYGYFYHKTILRGGIDKDLRFVAGNSHTIDKLTSDKTITTCDTDGDEVDTFKMAHPYIGETDAYLNHYICKTIEEFVYNKMVRLCGSSPTLKAEKSRVNLKLFLKYNELTYEKLEYLKSRLPDETDELLAFITKCCGRYAGDMLFD